MQKLGLNTVFTLSLILFAFEGYSKTVGHKASNMAYWEKAAEAYVVGLKELECPSNVTEALIPCVSHSITTADKLETELEKCKAITVSIRHCIRNGMETCHIHPDTYSLLADRLNSIVSDDLCTTNWEEEHEKYVILETS